MHGIDSVHTTVATLKYEMRKRVGCIRLQLHEIAANLYMKAFGTLAGPRLTKCTLALRYTLLPTHLQTKTKTAWAFIGMYCTIEVGRVRKYHSGVARFKVVLWKFVLYCRKKRTYTKIQLPFNTISILSMQTIGLQGNREIEIRFPNFVLNFYIFRYLSKLHDIVCVPGKWQLSDKNFDCFCVWYCFMKKAAKTNKFFLQTFFMHAIR